MHRKNNRNPHNERAELARALRTTADEIVKGINITEDVLLDKEYMKKVNKALSNISRGITATKCKVKDAINALNKVVVKNEKPDKEDRS